jgi:hypothetical protein
MKLTHVYPKMPGNEQTPIGGNINQVLYDIGQATLDMDDHTSVVAVMGGHENAVRFFLDELGKYEYNPKRLRPVNAVLKKGDEEQDYIEQTVHVGARGPYKSVMQSFDMAAWLNEQRAEKLGKVLSEKDLKALQMFGPSISHRTITHHPAREASTKTVKVELRTHIGNKKAVRFLANLLKQRNVSTLVIFEPDEEGGDLDCLPDLQAEYPQLDIVIFHEWCWQYGVTTTGDPDNWEEEFPALSDTKPEPKEVIVENAFIKGNIHVVAGPPEAFKTMGLIEVSSAILDERPVFDLLKVNQRHPIMFLCADMSTTQFDEFAAPFNLRKHGEDFRVLKGNAGIPKVTDPVLQKAVKGRILILDTMLDFAAIQKAFESGEWTQFMKDCRALMSVHGCIAVIMTAHTTRAEVRSDSDNINKAEYFKDSVTFHGKTDIGFGCKILKDTSQIKWERIKGRGFKYRNFSFTVAVYDEDGNSNLDRGRFPVCTKPEDMKALKESRAGRKPKGDADMTQRILDFKSQGKSNREIADLVSVSEKTVRRRLEYAEFDSPQGEHHEQ